MHALTVDIIIPPIENNLLTPYFLNVVQRLNAMIFFYEKKFLVISQQISKHLKCYSTDKKLQKKRKNRRESNFFSCIYTVWTKTSSDFHTWSPESRQREPNQTNDTVIYLFRKMIHYCISVSGRSVWISRISS